MRLTDKQHRVLIALTRVTAAGPLLMHEIKRRLGWHKSQHYTVLRELENAGMIVRKNYGHKEVELAVTAAGRQAATEHKPARHALSRKEYKKNWPDKDEPGLYGGPVRIPRARLGDEDIRDLYRGERYENFRGREIVDNTKAPRPSALEGYGVGVLS